MLKSRVSRERIGNFTALVPSCSTSKTYHEFHTAAVVHVDQDGIFMRSVLPPLILNIRIPRLTGEQVLSGPENSGPRDCISGAKPIVLNRQQVKSWMARISCADAAGLFPFLLLL